MLFQRSEVLTSAFGNLATALSAGDLLATVEKRFRLEQQETHGKPLDAMTFDIFLSHAYADRVLVLAVYTMLTQMGFSVYVDWIHDAGSLNRGQVTPDTARQLRKRMRQCKSLFYVTTDSHSSSKWMPWECGFFDGFDGNLGTFTTPSYAKHQGHVAILPVVDDQQNTFTGQEYLGLYCYAEKGSGGSRNVNIKPPDTISSNSPGVNFDSWIAGKWPG